MSDVSIDTDELDRFFETYGEAYANLDLDAIFDHYSVPLLSVVPDDVVWMDSADAVRKVMGAYLDTLRAGDYDRGEIDHLSYHPLSSAAVVASTAWTRYTADGDVFERLGTTYLLHRSDVGWEIVALVVHDPETAIPAARS